MPWRIEAEGCEYIINAGDDVTFSAPDVIGDEQIRCHADMYLGSPYLAFAEVNEGIVEKRSERYIYPVQIIIAKSLKNVE